MSSGKQVMKLYTEDQAKYFYECGRNFQINGEVTFDLAQQFVKPIELPSDEEMCKEAHSFYKLELQYKAFIQGAKRLRDKIQGGNK